MIPCMSSITSGPETTFRVTGAVPSTSRSGDRSRSRSIARYARDRRQRFRDQSPHCHTHRRDIGVKQYSLFDQFATTFAFLGFSLPTFFSGLVIIVIFSVKLEWFPFVFDSTVTGFWPNVQQSIMPVSVLALAGSASLTRFVRASMLEVINQDRSAQRVRKVFARRQSSCSTRSGTR